MYRCTLTRLTTGGLPSAEPGVSKVTSTQATEKDELDVMSWDDFSCNFFGDFYQQRMVIFTRKHWDLTSKNQGTQPGLPWLEFSPRTGG